MCTHDPSPNQAKPGKKGHSHSPPFLHLPPSNYSFSLSFPPASKFMLCCIICAVYKPRTLYTSTHDVTVQPKRLAYPLGPKTPQCLICTSSVKDENALGTLTFRLPQLPPLFSRTGGKRGGVFGVTSLMIPRMEAEGSDVMIESDRFR